MSGRSVQMELEAQGGSGAKPKPLSCTRAVVTWVACVLALICGSLLCWQQARLEYDLDSANGGVLAGNLVIYRSATGSVAADFLFAVSCCITRPNNPIMQKVAERSRELMAGLAAVMNTVMAGLAVSSQEESVDSVASNFFQLTTLYFVSRLYK